MRNVVMSCVQRPRLSASPYLLHGRPQLRQAGCQVLGTLTQLHGRRLIFHRGNGRLGRGHHLTTRLQDVKINQEVHTLTEDLFINVVFSSRAQRRRGWGGVLGCAKRQEQSSNCMLAL